ncbi:hypothetical protein [Ruegeria faecimaris]|uniref:hypothetical protein n=1 Tax=Ruegeria faecimaris TaxID=686389 RepID=UPI00163D7DDE|nr:hypothetical protein [Ruegeria faecimaris]
MTRVYVHMPQPNKATFTLAARTAHKNVFDTAPKYSDHDPDRIFRVTTFEQG